MALPPSALTIHLENFVSLPVNQRLLLLQKLNFVEVYYERAGKPRPPPGVDTTEAGPPPRPKPLASTALRWYHHPVKTPFVGPSVLTVLPGVSGGFVWFCLDFRAEVRQLSTWAVCNLF